MKLVTASRKSGWLTAKIHGSQYHVIGIELLEECDNLMLTIVVESAQLALIIDVSYFQKSEVTSILEVLLKRYIIPEVVLAEVVGILVDGPGCLVPLLGWSRNRSRCLQQKTSKW